MLFELLREELDRPKIVSVRLVRPSMGRAAAYAEFCRKTHAEVPPSVKWLVDDPRGLRDDGGMTRSVARKLDLNGLGLVELWATDGGEVVGVAFIRRHLTEEQRTWGGHITVVVRADVRRQGYGTEIMREAYGVARRIVKGDLLVTVDVKDTAGWRTVRRATFERVNIAQPKRRGWPAMIYRFTV